MPVVALLIVVKVKHLHLNSLGLQGCEDNDDFDILLQDALLQWVVENCDIKFTIVDE